jgi:hypothetical protein
MAAWHLQLVTDLTPEFSDDHGRVAVTLDELLRQHPRP